MNKLDEIKAWKKAWYKHGPIPREIVFKKINALIKMVEESAEEVDEFNAGHLAFDRGEPVDSEPAEFKHDTYGSGWAWAQHCSGTLQSRIDRAVEHFKILLADGCGLPTDSKVFEKIRSGVKFLTGKEGVARCDVAEECHGADLCKYDKPPGAGASSRSFIASTRTATGRATRRRGSDPSFSA